MAESLLAHLYTRIKGSQEDVATLSLQYILSNATVLNDGFNKIISQKLQVEYDDSIKYVCQATGDNKERPDMAGYDRDNKEKILCEMKFYAGLTDNQPLGYIDRLKDANGQGLIFVCPKVRVTSLWTKIKEQCKERHIEALSDFCVKVDGINMSIISWHEVLETLKEIGVTSARESLSDLEQLIGYCSQMDSDAFIPFTNDDFSPEMAKKAERYYRVVDETIDLLCADVNIKTSTKGVRASTNRSGYYRSLFIDDDFLITLDYDRNLWGDTSKIGSPFWMSIRNHDWEQTDEMLQIMRKIDNTIKDDEYYNYTFLALQPLPNATLEEVCKDLKEQILKYIDMFR